MSIRLIKAPLAIRFSEDDQHDERFEREYQRLSGVDDDAIGQWLKMAKAKGDTQDTDKVLLQLVIELHRKVDRLEMLLKDETPDRLGLAHSADIDAIGFDHFAFEEPTLHTGVHYYGRIEMPLYPKRDVALYFEALSSTQAKILRMHERDEKDWSSYVTARERILIREMKGNTP